MKIYTFVFLLACFTSSAIAQPIVSVVHNDVNTLVRTTPTNLVTNGSFETGGPSTGNAVSYFWTRPCNTNKPTGWTVSGDVMSYGFWGYFQTSDAAQYNVVACDNTLQTGVGDNMLSTAGDGNNLLYFGNYIVTAGAVAPAYNATSGEYIPRSGVAAANAAINWGPGAGVPTVPIILSQSVTGLTVGKYYELEFWVTGENFGGPDGIFDLQIGAKHFWLTAPGPDDQNGKGNDERYHVVFQADATTEPIAFKNYGHFNIINNTPEMDSWFAASGNSVTGEIALDDVIINERTVTVSGKVWVDVNGDGSSTAEANYTGMNFVNLVGPDGKILFSAQINADGTYSFPAPMNTAGMSIQISNTAAALEGNPNTAEAPLGYSNTTPVSISLTTTTLNITDKDFGIKLTVLPISLGKLAGTLKEGTVDLSWNSYSELNTLYFEIERSATGIFGGNNSSVAGKVNASGFSTVQKQYAFSEVKDANKVSYYRVKSVDANGSYQYSNVVAVRNTDKDAFVYTVNPNPFVDHISVGVKMAKKANVTLVISDASGRRLLTKQVSLSTGSNNFNLNDLGQLPKGVYVLEIACESAVSRVKVVKN